jgi:hypothetical protein
MKYDVSGQLLWNVTGHSSRYVKPRHVTVSPDGTVYVADQGASCIQVYHSDGTYSHRTPRTVDLRKPQAVCVTSENWLLVGYSDDDNSKISLVHADGDEIYDLITLYERVWCLALHENQYLAVGTTQGTFMYDVSNCLTVDQ